MNEHESNQLCVMFNCYVSELKYFARKSFRVARAPFTPSQLKNVRLTQTRYLFWSRASVACVVLSQFSCLDTFLAPCNNWREKKILLFNYKMCLRIFTTPTFTFLYKYNIISLFIFFGRLIIISSGLVYLFKILNKIIILLDSIDNRYDVYAHRYTYMQLPI